MTRAFDRPPKKRTPPGKGGVEVETLPRDSSERHCTDIHPSAQVSPAIADEINAEHERAYGKAREALEHARRAGELLLQAKAGMQHGEWLPWLTAHCSFSERTAQGYMRLARDWDKLQSKSATVADLGLRDALDLLAAPQSAEPESVELPTAGSDWETLWAWAGRQVAAPLNDFDRENALTLIPSKIHRQLGIRAEIAWTLEEHEKGLPMLRLCDVEDLMPPLFALADVINGKRFLRFDDALSPDSLTGLCACVTLVAQREIGLIVDEFGQRRKLYKRDDGTRIYEDRKRILGDFQAKLDALLEARKENDAERAMQLLGIEAGA